MKNRIIIILDDIRSAHNVGSILRTADGLGIEKVIMCGTTPYPLDPESETRLPHIAKKTHSKIQKTALGAEKTVEWTHISSLEDCIQSLQSTHSILSLEQSSTSITLNDVRNIYMNRSIALIVGNEVEGVSHTAQQYSEALIEIPMKGLKESFNVAIAAAIAMYELAK